jgi:N-acetylneuraminic acid mutarotase
MPTARGALAVGVIDNKIYAVGGSPAARERDFAVYDPATDSWTPLPPMPTARNHLAASAARGKFYAVGGRSGDIDGTTDVLEEFDPTTKIWMTKAAMPTARGGIAAVVADGCLYVFGGEGNPDNLAGVFEQNEVYDPRANSWKSMEPMPTPRHGIGAAAIGNRVYIPGGADVQGFGVTAVHEAFQSDESCSFTISPASGVYATTQRFDIILILERVGVSVAGLSASLDDQDVTAPLASCVLSGTLLAGGQTFRCPDLTGGTLGIGFHTLAVTLDLSDGSSVSDTVTWQVLENSEP